MKRAKLIAIPMGLAASALLLPGCAKSDGATPHAETPIGDNKYASVGAPGPDMTYLTDQSQIKLVSAPTVSYEPLATFRTAKPAGESATESGDGAATTSSGGGGGIMDKAKMALASLAGGLMGGGGPPGVAPPAANADTGDADAAGVKLADMREAMAALPEHPSKVTGEPVESAKTAAITLAKEHLAKRIFAMKISPDKSIGEAIGAAADPKAMEFSAAVMVDAKWLNPNKLEVEIMCKLSDVVSELESKFSTLDWSVVKGMEQDKGVSAKGTGDLKHEKGGTRHARPGEMSRQAAEEGGGLGP